MEKNVKLYSFADFDRSARVRWLLHELNLPFEEVRLNPRNGEHKTPEYLKLNPFGVVPALQVGEEVLVESGAICSYLTEAHPEAKLAPEVGSADRQKYLQWCYFACSSLEQVIAPLVAIRLFNRQDSREPELIAQADNLLQTVSHAIEGKKYILGDSFSTADILLGHDLALVQRCGMLENYPVLRDYVTRLEAREATKKANLFM